MLYCLGWLCGRCCIPWSETTGDGRGKQCKPPMGYRRWLIYLKIRTVFFLLPSKKKKWHIVRNEFVDVLYCFLDNIRIIYEYTLPLDLLIPSFKIPTTFTLGMRTEDIWIFYTLNLMAIMHKFLNAFYATSI